MRDCKHRFLILLFLSSSLFADIGFYTYQRTVTIKSHLENSVWHYDTTITFVQKQIGYAQLEMSEMTITPKGSYLDIVEDAWISGSVTELNLPDITNDFLFKGSLPIPQKAAVTGLLTWKSDTCYKAELQPSRYGFDQSFIDSISLRQSLDSRIAFLQQQTETYYEAVFACIALGERKHLRIRYLLPNTGSGAGVYTVPVLFHSQTGKQPRFVKMTVYANNSDLSYYLSTPSGNTEINDTTTVSIPYQKQIILKYKPAVTSTMQYTSFPAGTWKGNYLLINTEVNDSMLSRLSRPIQSVFVWRWNYPQNFISFDNQMKGLSSYAYEVIGQAKKMKEAIETLQKRGYRCGLIHLIEQGAEGFVTRTLDDSSASKAIAYLSTFDEQYLYATYGDQKEPDPTWVPQQVNTQTLIEKARSDLLSAFQDATTLMKDTNIYRHIVVTTIGGISTQYFSELRDTVSKILGSVTVDASAAQWRGVNLYASIPVSGAQQQLVPYLNYYFPTFFPVTVQLEIATGDQPYSFPLSGVRPEPFAVSIRTQTAWDTLFSWTGFSSKGEITKNVTTKPFIFTAPEDSGLAKIWAKDESHIADIEEIFPGGVFGIVNKACFLQATTGNISDAIAQSVPFLNDSEIHTPRTAVAKTKKLKTINAIKVTLHAGALSINAPGEVTRIEFYDLAGRMIGTINPCKYRTVSGAYRIPLKDLLMFKGCKVLIVRIFCGSLQKMVKLNMEGLR